MAVGIWTLVEKSGYLSILASSTFAASAYILIFAGALVMTTGFLGFGAIIREQKSCLSTVSVPLFLCGDCLSTVRTLAWRVSVGLCSVGAGKHHTCPPGWAYQLKQGTWDPREPEQGGCCGDCGGLALQVCRTSARRSALAIPMAVPSVFLLPLPLLPPLLLSLPLFYFSSSLLLLLLFPPKSSSLSPLPSSVPPSCSILPPFSTFPSPSPFSPTLPSLPPFPSRL